MPERGSSSPLRLLLRRATARAGLLASAAAAAAVAVATVCLVLAWLQRAVELAGRTTLPGVPADEVAAQVDLGALALVSAAPALVLLVAILAGTAVAQLARLIAAAREHETATVRARGMSRRQAWVLDGAEGLVVAIAGAVVGVALAAALAAVIGADAAAVLGQWPWVIVTVVILAAAFAVALRRGEQQRSATRATRATTGALVVVVLLAAGLAVWQLPLSRAGGFDPIVAIAPAVLLLAGALVALAVFGAAVAGWARPAAALPSLSPGYPARQIARRIPIAAVAVLLVALTVAQAVFASAFGATWQAMATDSAAVRTGTDLRVDTPPQSVSPGDVRDVAGIPGVDAVAPALTGALEIGSTVAQLVSTPAGALESVVTTAGGIVDTAGLAAAATADGTVVSTPIDLGDATSLHVEAQIGTAGDQVPPVTVVAVVVDAAGTPAALTLDGTRTPSGDGAAVYAGDAALPEGVAPWRLAALLAGTVPGFGTRTVTVTLQDVRTDVGTAVDVDGQVELTMAAADAVLWLSDGGALAAGEEPPPLGVAVTSEFASRLGLAEGDYFEFRYERTGRRGAAVASSIVDVVPGSASTLAVFVPLEQLIVSQLQRGTTITPANSVWAAGEAAAAADVSAALRDRPVATSAPGPAADVVGALAPGWWIATAGAIALSLVAAFAIVQTLAISRRRELGVLRALGIPPGGQARMRAAELGTVLGTALVLGALAGAAVSWLVVPDLVRAVTPGILPITGGVSFSWPPLGVAAAVLAAGLVAVIAIAAQGVRRDARTATVGEDAR